MPAQQKQRVGPLRRFAQSLHERIGQPRRRKISMALHRGPAGNRRRAGVVRRRAEADARTEQPVEPARPGFAVCCGADQGLGRISQDTLESALGDNGQALTILKVILKVISNVIAHDTAVDNRRRADTGADMPVAEHAQGQRYFVHSAAHSCQPCAQTSKTSSSRVACAGSPDGVCAATNSSAPQPVSNSPQCVNAVWRGRIKS